MSGNTHARNTITIGNTAFTKIVVNSDISVSSLEFCFQKEIGVWGNAPFGPFVYTKGQKAEKKKTVKRPLNDFDYKNFFHFGIYFKVETIDVI